MITYINRAGPLDCHTKIGPPPKVVPPDRFLRKKWSPGPILAAKIGLPGLILAAKIGPPLAKNSPPTDHDARTEFGSPD